MELQPETESKEGQQPGRWGSKRAECKSEGLLPGVSWGSGQLWVVVVQQGCVGVSTRKDISKTHLARCG